MRPVTPDRPATMYTKESSKHLTAFDWLAIAGGLVNLAVVSVIFGFALFT